MTRASLQKKECSGLFDNRKIVLCAAALATLSYFLSESNTFGYSRDYWNYDRFFNLLRVNFTDYFNAHRFEPGFALVAHLLVAITQSNAVVYAAIVAASVFFKTLAIGRWSQEWTFFALAMVLFFLKFFALHELTQVRASIALLLIILAFHFRINGNIRIAILFSILAFSFHYSSSLLVPFLFLPMLSARSTMLAGVAIYTVISFFSLQLIPIAENYFVSVESTLRSVVDSGGLRPLSPILIPEYYLIVISLTLWKDLTRPMRMIVTIQVIGLAFCLAFSDYPVLAVRAHELFTFLWVVYVAQASACRDLVKVATFIFVIAMSALGFYVYFLGDFFI